MTNKKIHNPKTGKYYSVRKRTTSKSKKGQILGNYKTRAAKTIKRSASGALRKLSNT